MSDSDQPSVHRVLKPSKPCDSRLPFPEPYVSFNPNLFDDQHWQLRDLYKLCCTLQVFKKIAMPPNIDQMSEEQKKLVFIRYLHHWHKTPIQVDARRRKGTGNFSLLQVEIALTDEPAPNKNPPTVEQQKFLTPLKTKTRKNPDGTPISILKQNGMRYSEYRKYSIALKQLLSPSVEGYRETRQIKHSIFNGTKIIPPRQQIYDSWLADAGFNPEQDSDDEAFNSPVRQHIHDFHQQRAAAAAAAAQTPVTPLAGHQQQQARPAQSPSGFRPITPIAENKTLTAEENAKIDKQHENRHKKINYEETRADKTPEDGDSDDDEAALYDDGEETDNSDAGYTPVKRVSNRKPTPFIRKEDTPMMDDDDDDDDMYSDIDDSASQNINTPSVNKDTKGNNNNSQQQGNNNINNNSSNSIMQDQDDDTFNLSDDDEFLQPEEYIAKATPQNNQQQQQQLAMPTPTIQKPAPTTTAAATTASTNINNNGSNNSNTNNDDDLFDSTRPATRRQSLLRQQKMQQQPQQPVAVPQQPPRTTTARPFTRSTSAATNNLAANNANSLTSLRNPQSAYNNQSNAQKPLKQATSEELVKKMNDLQL